MFLIGHPHQGTGRFALSAATDNSNLGIGVIFQVIDMDDEIFWSREVTQVEGHFDIIDHTAPDHSQLAVVSHSDIDNLLNPGDIRSKGGDNDAASGLAKNCLKSLAHDAFRWRMAGP